MTTLKDRDATTLPLSPTEAPELSVKAVKKISSWRQVRNALTRHPRLVQLVILLTLMGSTGMLLLCLLFRGAWSKHPDNFMILSAILKMELSRETALVIDNQNTQKVVTRTFSTLEPQLATDGWVWINRFGSTVTYGKQDQRLIASCSAYSPLYLICDLSEIP